MRVLLDECLPRQLAPLLEGHDTRTVSEQGWAGLANGRLLNAALEAGFDAFITADQNLEYQQNLSGSALVVLVLRARTNRLDDLLRLVPKVLVALVLVRPGELRVVDAG